MMNDTDLLQILLSQITALDERTQESLNKISNKVDNLQEDINLVKRQQCSSPSLCIELSKQLIAASTTLKEQDVTIAIHQSWIDKLDGKMIGIASAVGAIWSGILVVVAYFYKFSN